MLWWLAAFFVAFGLFSNAVVYLFIAGIFVMFAGLVEQD